VGWGVSGQRLRKEQDTVIKKINKIHSKLCETLDTGAQPVTAPSQPSLSKRTQPLCGVVALRGHRDERG
jgi:hypothetical protein